MNRQLFRKVCSLTCGTEQMHQLLNCVVKPHEGMDLARFCFPSLSESLRHNQVFHDKLGEITSPLCISFLLGKNSGIE